MNRLERYVPPGVDYRREFNLIAYGWIASFLFSLTFFGNYYNRYNSLFEQLGTVKILREGAVMPDFMEILGVSLTGFIILAVSVIAIFIYHYAYHYQGSKSIYLMKRLPNRRELWRRCLALPVAAALLSLLAAFILLMIYFGLYMAITPEACLAPHQWQKIWNVLLGAAL